MIKLLDKSYRNKIIEYLNIEKEVNTFNIFEFNKYGFEKFFFEIYSDVDEKGNLNGILFKCFEYLTFYSHEKFDVEGFCEIIKTFNYKEIAGKSSCVDLLAKNLGLLKYKKANLCKLSNMGGVNISLDEGLKLKKINIFNIAKIVKLYEEINEFQNTTIDSVNMNLKSGRGYYIQENKRAISMAKSTAENENTAMIIGVGTHPDYRNRSLATICMIKLCRELLSKNIEPCLLYNTEEAGKIYHKLGFEDIDKWSIYYNK